jgi:ribonuclease HI
MSELTTSARWWHAPRKLFFDGSVCAKGCGISCVMVSPSGVIHELAARLEFACINHQAEYEALVAGLEWLVDMKIRHVEV